LCERCADQERNGRRDGDGGLPGAAEQPEGEPAKQTSVQTRLRWKTCERRITDCRRQQIGGERDAGRDVGAKPRPVVRGQPRARGNAHTATSLTVLAGFCGSHVTFPVSSE